MTPITTIRSRSFVLPSVNIDTDQIIPARFLTTTTKAGLGAHCFHDWRHRADGSLDTEAPLNRRDPARQRILVAGHNFGCGSSREHAVWALRENGIQAVIATAVADIFKRNALKNGVVPVVIDAASHAALVAGPAATVVVDLERLIVSWPGGEAKFAIEPFARHCLLEGVDELGYLLKQEAAISAFESAG